MKSIYQSPRNGANYADSRQTRAVEIGTSATIEQKGTLIMNPNILSPDRLRELQAVQGTRGLIGGMVAKVALFPQATYNDDGEIVGSYYCDVIAEAPALVDAVTRNGDKKYHDDDDVFSLTKLFNDVSGNVTRKRDKAIVDGHKFPNVEAIRDDDEGTVYIVNFDSAPASKMVGA